MLGIYGMWILKILILDYREKSCCWEDFYCLVIGAFVQIWNESASNGYELAISRLMECILALLAGKLGFKPVLLKLLACRTLTAILKLVKLSNCDK